MKEINTMIRRRIFGCFVLFLAGLVTLLGCRKNHAKLPSDFVLKSGAVVISSHRFADELDLKLSAYPFDLKQHPSEYNTVVLDLVAELSDQVVLLAEARALGIKVSELALQNAEKEVRSDYPGDSFEKMLLENAISYPVWKEQLEKDLIVDELIRTQLIDSQEISGEDALAFYRKLEKRNGTEVVAPIDEKDFIQRLKEMKSQDAYDGWLAGLKDRHQVQINKKAVAAFLAQIK